MEVPRFPRIPSFSFQILSLVPQLCLLPCPPHPSLSVSGDVPPVFTHSPPLPHPPPPPQLLPHSLPSLALCLQLPSLPQQLVIVESGGAIAGRAGSGGAAAGGAGSGGAGYGGAGFRGARLGLVTLGSWLWG
ncbi:unnamed protein product [Closterium sp. NIES-53]